MNRTGPRTALAVALAADALASEALLAATLHGATARHLAPQLIAFAALNALLPLALAGDARIRARRVERRVPQQCLSPDPFATTDTDGN